MISILSVVTIFKNATLQKNVRIATPVQTVHVASPVQHVRVASPAQHVRVASPVQHVRTVSPVQHVRVASPVQLVSPAAPCTHHCADCTQNTNTVPASKPKTCGQSKVHLQFICFRDIMIYGLTTPFSYLLSFILAFYICATPDVIISVPSTQLYLYDAKREGTGACVHKSPKWLPTTW